MLERSKHPQPQNYAGNEVLAIFLIVEKIRFFYKKYIFATFPDFFLAPQDSEFQDLADPGCVRPYIG